MRDQARGDYKKRDDTARLVTDGASDAWGFGKANHAMSPGALTGKTIADDKGPAHNAGAGLATNRTITPDWSLEDSETIAIGDWVIWERKHGKVYVSLLNCAGA